jgi:hypothetical protein
MNPWESNGMSRSARHRLTLTDTAAVSTDTTPSPVCGDSQRKCWGRPLGKLMAWHAEASRHASHATIAITSALLFAGTAHATCLETWPPDMKERPAFTCVPLTDRLLVGLEGASKVEVIKAMKALGRPFGGEESVLQFVSVADRYSGYMNFEIKDDRVVRIFGIVDSGDSDSTLMRFIWNPSYHGPGANPCSDLPGSRYARCDK